MSDEQNNNMDELKSSLRSKLIRPVDENYDKARKVYKGTIIKKPGLIVRRVDVADVISCTNFPRENDYDRLAKIKSKYDPTNLFRVNQNIKPTG